MNQTQEERKLSIAEEALDCSTNSPCQYYRICAETSKENLPDDIRVKRVNTHFVIVIITMSKQRGILTCPQYCLSLCEI